MQDKEVKKQVVIVTPYINLYEYILKLIKSVHTQYSYVFALIDNGSDNETKKELKYLREKPEFAMVENPTNIGVAASWNQGIKFAKQAFNADWVVILNNDILLHPSCIDKMIEVSEKGSFPLVSATDKAKECETPEKIFDLAIPENEIIVDKPEFSCYVLNIRLLQKLGERELKDHEFPGLFDEKFYPAYFEDNDFHYRLKLAGMRGVKTNQAIYYHFGSRTIRENKNMENIVKNSYLENEQKYIDKWGGKPGEEKHIIPYNIIKK